MVSKVKVVERIPVTRPPVGWRKSIPLVIKLQVIVNQRGLGPDGEPLDAIGAGVQFDHRPPLHEREFDQTLDDTVPAANDLRYIFAVPVRYHRELSSLDVKRMRKAERQRKSEETHQARLGQRPLGAKRQRYTRIGFRRHPAGQI